MIFVVGGGGGGFNPNKPLIHANAPLGSSVTFALSGGSSTTVTSDKAYPNEDGVTADYYFSCKDTGTYTVTGTLSPDTTSATVVVSAVKQYNVKLDYKLWFVKNGVLVSNTFNNSTRQTFVQNQGNYRFTTTANYVAAAWSPSKVDLTNRSLVYLQLTKAGDSTNKYGVSAVPTGCPCLAISVNAPTVNEGPYTVTGLDQSVKMTNSKGNITTEIHSLDVSSVSGEYYVDITLAGSDDFSGSKAYVNVLNFYVQ